MNTVTLGTKVNALGISKLNVADGTTARCVLIDRDPACKYIAYDGDLGKKVEVDQDILIQYGLKASPTFFFLVAKLNTDLKGNVVDDSFVIEYLQLGSNVYNEFADAVEENPQFTSVKLSKVSKKMGDKDFSYVKPTPSNYQVPDSVLAKIATLSDDQKAAMWQLIDKSTSMSIAEYKALRANDSEYTYRVQSRAAMLANRPGAAPAPQVAAAPQAPQIAAPQAPVYQAPVAPAQPAYQAPAYQAPQAPAYQAPQAPAVDMPAFTAAPSAPADFATANDFGAPSGDAFDF